MATPTNKPRPFTCSLHKELPKNLYGLINYLVCHAYTNIPEYTAGKPNVIHKRSAINPKDRPDAWTLYHNNNIIIKILDISVDMQYNPVKYKDFKNNITAFIPLTSTVDNWTTANKKNLIIENKDVSIKKRHFVVIEDFLPCKTYHGGLEQESKTGGSINNKKTGICCCYKIAYTTNTAEILQSPPCKGYKISINNKPDFPDINNKVISAADWNKTIDFLNEIITARMNSPKYKVLYDILSFNEITEDNNFEDSNNHPAKGNAENYLNMFVRNKINDAKVKTTDTTIDKQKIYEVLDAIYAVDLTEKYKYTPLPLFTIATTKIKFYKEYPDAGFAEKNILNESCYKFIGNYGHHFALYETKFLSSDIDYNLMYKNNLNELTTIIKNIKENDEQVILTDFLQTVQSVISIQLLQCVCYSDCNSYHVCWCFGHNDFNKYS